MMPAKTFAFYCVVFACGVLTSVYLIWWRETWFDGFLAAVATALVLIPIFIRREYRFVTELEAEAQRDLRAQMHAGNEMLRLARENDREQLVLARAEDVKSIRWWQNEYKSALEVNAQLRLRSKREHDPVTGKFVKRAPKLLK